jgi:hypothetical protein
MFPLAVRVSTARDNDDRCPGDAGEPRPGVEQTAAAFDQERQAILGSAIQNVYLGGRERAHELAALIEPLVGQRDERSPLRIHGKLLANLAVPEKAPVRLLHGLGGCGTTQLALEAAYAAPPHAAEAWWDEPSSR